MRVFEEVLTSLLRASGKKQVDICLELGIPKQKMSNWKSGYTDPNLEDLVKLANYFDVSIDYLLGREDESGSKI